MTHHCSILKVNVISPIRRRCFSGSRDPYRTACPNSTSEAVSAIKKGKHIPVRDRETSRLPHFLDNRLTDGSKVVSITRAALYPPGRFLVLISVRGWVDPRATVRLEGLCQLKNQMTSSRNEPATFRLVHSTSTNYATACPGKRGGEKVNLLHYV
jgi:hypothetical protein